MVTKKGVEDAVDDLVHVPLQAILIADSFTTKFEPITLECPKVLLPLVNTPMIDYTLAWLESAHVEEVFVLCASHSKQITNYLHNSKWVNKPNFPVTTIECTSAGDALRLIHKQNVIKGDFILVSGDTVSNMMLTQALDKHKERKLDDNNAVMTMVIKQSEVTRGGVIIAMDPTTEELLHYEEKTDDIELSKSCVSVNPCFTLHYDKQDCYIDICSPQVLSLFTDSNVDYQHLRGDLVKGLLADEVMGFKIFTHETDSSCYVARIDNFGSYESISKDIIERRTYPFVPDDLFLIATSEIHGPFDLTQSLTYIGKDTIIGDKTVISNSVVGDGCKIGSNVAIYGCYIWNNVTIEDGCKLRDAILCDGAVMKSGAVLEAGVVLSYKVVVGQGIVVPSYSKVSLLPQPVKNEHAYADDISILEKGETVNIGVVSDMVEDGSGFLWSKSEVDHEAPIPESDEEIFEKRVEEILLREAAIASSILQNVKAVWKCSKMGIDKCAEVVFYLIMKLALNNSKKSGNDLVKEANDMVLKWGGLLRQFSRGANEQIQVILKFEEMCLESMQEYAPLFVQVLYILYDKNKIQEEAILKWANDDKDKVFVKQSEKFIQWLREASEENYREFQETDLKRLIEGGVQVRKSRPTLCAETDWKRLMDDRRAQAKKSRSMKTDLKRLNEGGVQCLSIS